MPLPSPRPWACLPGIVLAAVAGAFAATPTFWRLATQQDFLAGEVEGLSIASDGVVSLAPATDLLHEATEPFYWSLVVDREGRLYAGSGNDGKVLRIDAAGRATVLADTNELQVHALAVDRAGNVYAGSSPRGKVYKIAPDGTESIFFDPDDRYIWDIAVDPLGDVIVATGDKAVVYRVRPNGEARPIFESQETHVMCLAVDADGNVYAGSDPNGLVFKIDRNDKVSVLFDTPLQEVHALLLDSRRNVYAAAIAGDRASRMPSAPAPEPTSTTTSVSPTAPPAGETVTVTVTASAALPTTSATSGTGSPAGAVYRIAPNGSAERLWESSDDLPLSLALASDDRIMVGTGKNGRIFMVRQDKTSSLLLRAEADQVTAIASPDARAFFFATSNPAKVYRLTSTRRSEGVYRSAIRDTSTVSSWGKIRWQARVPPETSLAIQTRSGNSAKPDNTWSDWSPAYTNPEGEQIQSPEGRFLQWRAVLRSNGGATPELLELTAVYLQQNLRPEVSEITIHPPGETFQKPLVAGGQLEILGADEPLDNPDAGFGTTGAAPAPGTGAPTMSPTAFSRKIYRKGYQTVTWQATDPNEDRLRYDVYYRAEGDVLWRLLRAGLTEPVIAWDTVAMPDGRYTLKIVASDAPSNPEALAATGEKESRIFEVDNTPPRVTGLTAARAEGGHRVRLRAEDDGSPIQKVEYAVDSGSWRVVYPSDGIADSRQEDFDFIVSGTTEGVHVLVVKVTDTLRNVATARAELR